MLAYWPNLQQTKAGSFEVLDRHNVERNPPMGQAPVAGPRNLVERVSGELFTVSGRGPSSTL